MQNKKVYYNNTTKNYNILLNIGISMKYPVCKETNLVISEHQGVEIDYCPKCRGVWLDRGELDKIIERLSSYSKLCELFD